MPMHSYNQGNIDWGVTNKEAVILEYKENLALRTCIILENCQKISTILHRLSSNLTMLLVSCNI